MYEKMQKLNCKHRLMKKYKLVLFQERYLLIQRIHYYLIIIQNTLKEK